jgi:hypothetical protein
MNCPNCNNKISDDKINIQSDIAQCTSCSLIFKISENLIQDDGFEIDNPPAGSWIRRESNNIIVGATTRSPIAFFMVPFMTVWSGISLGGIYGTQLLSGSFNPLMSVFGIPFIIGTVIFGSLTLMAIAGKVELTLNKEGGQVFTGLSKLGLTKKFTWAEVTTAKETTINYRYPGSKNAAIQLEGKKRFHLRAALLKRDAITC